MQPSGSKKKVCPSNSQDYYISNDLSSLQRPTLQRYTSCGMVMLTDTGLIDIAQVVPPASSTSANPADGARKSKRKVCVIYAVYYAGGIFYIGSRSPPLELVVTTPDCRTLALSSVYHFSRSLALYLALTT
jgi:hypothetical protein